MEMDLPEPSSLYKHLPTGMTLVRKGMNDDELPWTPVYFFEHRNSMPSDVELLNFYSEKHPEAPFVNSFLINQLRPDFTRVTLAYNKDILAKPENKKGQARLWYTKLWGLRGETRWVDFTNGAIKNILREEFGCML